MFDTLVAVFLVEVQNRFGIAMRGVNMAACFECRSKLCVVVDFSVVNNLQRTVLIGHRLVARLDVYNAKTTMTETNPACLRVDEDTLIVRPAMRKDVAHALQRRGINAARRSAR